MSTRRRFTEEEDRVILSKISENPSNIAQCLRELSVELDRSFSTLQTRWYKTLAKKDMSTKTNTMFMTYGKKNINPNTKVCVCATFNVVAPLKSLSLVNSLKNTPNASPKIK